MHLWVLTMLVRSLVQLVRGQGKAGVEWKSHRTRGGGQVPGYIPLQFQLLCVYNRLSLAVSIR